MTIDQFETVRKYLDEDCQSHLKAHGKWRLDAGKLWGALEAAGIEVQEGRATTEEEYCRDFARRVVASGVDPSDLEATMSRVITEIKEAKEKDDDN